MEENVLKDFETFNEFPDKYLKINKNSNYHFIKKLKECFITKENLDSMYTLKVLNKDKIILEKSYYDVVTGNLVLNTRSIRDIKTDTEELINPEENVEKISLSSILNIDENGVYYLCREDINTLVNYKEESSKTYGLKPRKNYF